MNRDIMAHKNKHRKRVAPYGLIVPMGNSGIWRAHIRRIVGSLALLLPLTTGGVCQELPGTVDDRLFEAFAPSIDLERPDLVFLYKSGRKGGSSVGFHVAAPGGRKFVTFAPDNTSSDPESEVVSYRLARFLGFSELYNPVTYVTLGPKATARFKILLNTHAETDPDRKVNWNSNVKQLKDHPDTIFGILRSRPKGKVYTVTTLGSGGLFDENSFIAPMIQASGSMPSAKMVSLPGVKGPAADAPPKPSETESELARELSNIFLVDQLLGQWDRFWKNLEARGDGSGRLRFLARDNGGATPSDWEWHANYEKWLSRYDHDVIVKLRELHAFLQGDTKRLGPYETAAQWSKAIGFIKPASVDTFKEKLERFVEKRLPSLENKYRDSMYFANRRPVSVTASASTPEASATIELPPALLKPLKPASSAPFLQPSAKAPAAPQN